MATISPVDFSIALYTIPKLPPMASQLKALVCKMRQGTYCQAPPASGIRRPDLPQPLRLPCSQGFCGRGRSNLNPLSGASFTRCSRMCKCECMILIKHRAEQVAGGALLTFLQQRLAQKASLTANPRAKNKGLYPAAGFLLLSHVSCRSRAFWKVFSVLQPLNRDPLWGLVEVLSTRQ